MYWVPVKFPATVSSSAQCQHMRWLNTVIITSLTRSDKSDLSLVMFSSTQQRPSEEHSFFSHTHVKSCIFSCWPFVNRSKKMSLENHPATDNPGYIKKRWRWFPGEERVLVYQPLQQTLDHCPKTKYFNMSIFPIDNRGTQPVCIQNPKVFFSWRNLQAIDIICSGWDADIRIRHQGMGGRTRGSGFNWKKVGLDSILGRNSPWHRWWGIGSGCPEKWRPQSLGWRKLRAIWCSGRCPLSVAQGMELDSL